MPASISSGEDPGKVPRELLGRCGNRKMRVERPQGVSAADFAGSIWGYRPSGRQLHFNGRGERDIPKVMRRFQKLESDLPLFLLIRAHVYHAALLAYS